MKSLALLLVLSVAVSEASTVNVLLKHSIRQTPPAGLTDFLQGFIQGLEENSNSPGACSNDLIAADNDYIAIASDVQRIIGGDEMAIMQLITDVQAFYNTLAGSNSDCQWTTLINEFKSLSTAAGRDQILGNVMKNLSPIFSDAEKLSSCPTNWVICGYDVAQIFSMIFNWKITVPERQFDVVQASNFLSGFVSGIETPGSDGTCVTDVDGLSGLAENIVSEIEKAFGGDIAAALQAFTDVKQLLSDVEGFNSDCDFTGLLTAVESLGTTAGWVKVAQNFMSNFGTIETDATAFTQCTSNPAQCGFSLGEILRLTLGWSLGPDSAVYAAPTATWFEGLLQGLQTDPNSANECVGDINGLQSLVQTIITDIEKVADDFTLVFQLVKDAKTLLTDLKNIETPCNIPALLTVLKSLTTQQGFATVVNNVKLNLATIMTDAPAILDCASDVATCGENVGVILRLALGWSL